MDQELRNSMREQLTRFSDARLGFASGIQDAASILRKIEAESGASRDDVLFAVQSAMGLTDEDFAEAGAMILEELASRAEHKTTLDAA